MKRHQALQDYSRDHHFFLLEAREIRWALEGSEHGRPARHVVRSFLDFWHDDGLLHLREEEEVLLPCYAELAPSQTQQDHIERVLDEHRRLRRRVATLKQRVETGAPFEALLGRVGERLHDHVRFEERTVFEHLQEVLADEELAIIGEASRQFRLEHRSAAAIGPRKEK